MDFRNLNVGQKILWKRANDPKAKARVAVIEYVDRNAYGVVYRCRDNQSSAHKVSVLPSWIVEVWR